MQKNEILSEQGLDGTVAPHGVPWSSSVTTEITIQRPAVEDGTTYFDTAELISRLDPNDLPLWKERASRLIKRFMHCEKVSVYSRVRRSWKILDEDEDILEEKIKTHKDLYNSLSEEAKTYFTPTGNDISNQPKQPRKVRVGLMLPSSLISKIEEFARKTGNSRNATIQMLLANELDRK